MATNSPASKEKQQLIRKLCNRRQGLIEAKKNETNLDDITLILRDLEETDRELMTISSGGIY